MRRKIEIAQGSFLAASQWRRAGRRKLMRGNTGERTILNNKETIRGRWELFSVGEAGVGEWQITGRPRDVARGFGHLFSWEIPGGLDGGPQERGVRGKAHSSRENRSP